jgi:hypothetical protein
MTPLTHLRHLIALSYALQAMLVLFTAALILMLAAACRLADELSAGLIALSAITGVCITQAYWLFGKQAAMRLRLKKLLHDWERQQ